MCCRLLIRLILLTLILLVPSAATAQDTVNWNGLILTLPDGWMTEEFEGRLYLGNAEAITASRAGDLPDDLLLTIEYRVGTSRDLFFSGRNNTPDFRLNTDYDNTAIADGGQVFGWLVLIPPAYVLTATAPDIESALPTLARFLEGITIGNEQPSEQLTQQIQWNNLRFAMPQDWLMGALGIPHTYVLQSQADRATQAATFRVTALTVTLRDLSYIRPMIIPDAIRYIGGGFYGPPESALTGDLEITTDGNLTLVRLPLRPDDGGDAVMGEALLYLTPDHAYLVTGIAEPEFWEASEGALWEAFKASLEFVE